MFEFFFYDIGGYPVKFRVIERGFVNLIQSVIYFSCRRKIMIRIPVFFQIDYDSG
jgi:hypothetical protein